MEWNIMDFAAGQSEGVVRVFEGMAKRQEERTRTVAVAAGFSSVEEYKLHRKKELEKEAREHDEWVEDMLARMGKEEFRRYWDEHPQRGSPVPDMLPPSQCGCEEHLHPYFCPEALESYKSQDLPALMSFLDHQHNPHLEGLANVTGDDFNSSYPEKLQRGWDQVMPTKSLDLPFWANNDSVIKKIVEIGCQSISSSDSAPTYSVPASPMEQTHNEAYTSSMDAPALEKDASLHDKIGDQMVVEDQRGSEQPKYDFQKSLRTRIAAKPQIVKRGGLRSEKSSGKNIRKVQRSRTTRISKSYAGPAARTRSHKAVEFYELGHNGLPQPCQPH